MTLEDFFSVNEMKDGLTTSARVKELVNAMLEERDSVLKNVGDVTRQWSTVGSTITVTENKECLDLFVQLNGIVFINKWLKDAQRLGCEPSDGSAEELITALLHTVEKLHINYEQSVAYGIRATVEKLLSHSSLRVQEKATSLFDSWKQLVIGEAITGLGDEVSQTIPSVGDCEPSIAVAHEEKHVNTSDDKGPKMCSGDVLLDKVDDLETEKDYEDKTLQHENMKEEGSGVKKPFEESLCNEGEFALCHLEGDASHSTSAAAVPKEEGLVSNQFIGKEELMQEVASPSDRLGAMEISPSPMEKELEPLTSSDLQTDTAIEVDNIFGESATGDMRTDMSLSLKDNSSLNVDETPSNQSETMTVSQNLGGDCDTNNLKVSITEDTQMLESSEKSTSRGYSNSINGKQSSSESEDTDFFKTIKGDYDEVNEKRSDFDLSYGLDDALEIARQVANEVEREVEDQIETSSMASQKILETEETHPRSPASVHGDETQIDECASKEPNDQNDPNADSSQVPNNEQETESKSDKGIIEFDLNKDICSNDTDQPLDTFSVPVSIVSASRATAAPGFPESPLQFEGAHGWKGSAATSAFRPAFPRKVYDSDKVANNLNNRQNCLDFDLNDRSEEGDIQAADLLSQKQILHYGESSGEAKLNLDLNRISDEGDAPPSNWRSSERLLLSRNGHHNASPSSSSSSMQQPLRNFDLNDQPSLFNDSSEFNLKSASQKLHSFLGPRSGNNVISIMGAKVEVNRTDSSHHPSFLQNGRILEHNPDVSMTSEGILGIGSAVLYPHPSMFTHNGLTSGPTGPFSPVMYGPGGPIPYMVDSRGASVVPQYLGSQSPFPVSGIYGMRSPSLPGPLRPNFELNLGLIGERANKESRGLRQFFGPGPKQSLDELRSNFHHSNSIGFGKRKEPDDGWEPYPFDYKHQYPQWR